MWKFTISTAWCHGYGQGMADAVELVKRHQLVDGQIDNVVDEVSGLMRISRDKPVEARHSWKNVVMIAIVWLHDIQLSRAAIGINAEGVENTNDLIRLILIQQQSTASPH